MHTAAEVQGYIKSGATLTRTGWSWHPQWSIAEKQIKCFAYIMGLHSEIRWHKGIIPIAFYL